MATNFFLIGYHFEEFSSQVAIRNKINFTTWKMIKRVAASEPSQLLSPKKRGQDRFDGT